jgi:hypothetical protein
VAVERTIRWVTSCVAGAALLLVLASPVGAAGWYRTSTIGSTAPTDLAAAAGIAMRADGSYVVSDVLQSRLVIMNADDTLRSVVPMNESHRDERVAGITIAQTSDGELLLGSVFEGSVERLTTTGTRVSRWEGLGMPFAVTEDTDGTVLVGEWASGTVTRRDASGTVIETLTASGAAPGQTQQPTSIVRDPTDGSLWITDLQRGVVINLAPDGSYVDEFAAIDAWAVDVAADGSLYVAYDAWQVGHFDRSGTLLATITTPGTGAGETVWTTEVEVAPDGTVLVSDGALGRVSRYTSGGAHVRTVGTTPPRASSLRMVSGAVEAPAGRTWALDAESDALRLVDADGTTTNVPGVFAMPAALFAQDGRKLASDPSTGGLWIGQASTGTIQRRLADGSLADSFGAVGVGPGEFQQLVDIAGAPDGTVYALDAATSRVQHLAADGSVLHSWGSAGSGDGEFGALVAVGVAPDGDVWVLDGIGPRLQRFSVDGTHEVTFPFSASPAAIDLQYFPGIAVSPDGARLAISIASCSCVHILATADGTTSSIVDADVTGADARPIKPTDVAWSASGDLIVTETFANRVTRWRYDGAAPNVTLAAAGGERSVAFTASASDAGTGLHATPYSWDGGSTWTATATRTESGLGWNEARSARLLVRDRAGNVADVSATGRSRADTTAPKVPGIVTRIPAGAIIAGGATIPIGAIDDETGVATYVATFRGQPLTIRDGAIVFDGTLHGRGVLRILITNGAGLTSLYERTITIDRTPPQLDVVGQRFAFGRSIEVGVRDDGATRSLRVGPLRLGTNRKVVRVRDSAGNLATARVVVHRRISLARPELNRDLRLRGGIRHDPALNGIVFDYDSPHFSWYQGTEVAPQLVQEVQWRLQRWGYLDRDRRRSGRLDFATIEAVKRFQRAEGLPAIATVGPRTRAAMDARLLAER